MLKNMEKYLQYILSLNSDHKLTRLTIDTLDTVQCKDALMLELI